MHHFEIRKYSSLITVHLKREKPSITVIMCVQTGVLNLHILYLFKLFEEWGKPWLCWLLVQIHFPPGISSQCYYVILLLVRIRRANKWACSYPLLASSTCPVLECISPILKKKKLVKIFILLDVLKIKYAWRLMYRYAIFYLCDLFTLTLSHSHFSGYWKFFWKLHSVL